MKKPFPAIKGKTALTITRQAAGKAGLAMPIPPGAIHVPVVFRCRLPQFG